MDSIYQICSTYVIIDYVLFYTFLSADAFYTFCKCERSLLNNLHSVSLLQ